MEVSGQLTGEVDNPMIEKAKGEVRKNLPDSANETLDKYINKAAGLTKRINAFGMEESPVYYREILSWIDVPLQGRVSQRDSPGRWFPTLTEEVPSFVPDDGNFFQKVQWDSVDSDVLNLGAEGGWTYLDTPHFRLKYDSRKIKFDLAMKRIVGEMEDLYYKARGIPFNFPRVQDTLVPLKYRISIYGSDRDFVNDNEVTSRAGCYSQGVSHINGEMLGISGNIKWTTKVEEILFKEIVHQWIHDIQIPEILEGTPFGEGLACYMEDWAYMNIRARSVNEKLSSYMKRAAAARKPRFNVQSKLERKYRFTGDGFYRFMHAPSSIYDSTDKRHFTCRNTIKAYLITVYFIHMDGNGMNFREFLRMRQNGDPLDICYRRLLYGRSWDEVEKDCVAQWKKFGINLKNF